MTSSPDIPDLIAKLTSRIDVLERSSLDSADLSVALTSRIAELEGLSAAAALAPNPYYISPSGKAVQEPTVTKIGLNTNPDPGVLLNVRTPVNVGPKPIWIRDSGSELNLFEVDHFGDGNFGGLVVAASVRLNGGAPSTVRTENHTTENLQDLLNEIFDCTAGPLKCKIGVSAAGAIGIISKRDGSVNELTIEVEGGTIDGGGNIKLSLANSAVMLYCIDNASKWLVIGKK